MNVVPERIDFVKPGQGTDRPVGSMVTHKEQNVQIEQGQGDQNASDDDQNILRVV